MATIPHCLSCFEALAAHLEGRDAMSLSEIQTSWSAYVAEKSGEAGEAGNKKQLPALARLVSAASASSSGTSTPSSESSTSLSTSTAATSTSSLPITESPLFVTWNTVAKDGDIHLRGCIGTFEDQDIADGVPSYALTSALHDTRFDPIRLRELPSLAVSVTLLTDFEDADDPLDWQLGTHGVRISFTNHGRRYGATYLPDVAPEQGWTKEETIVSLMRKAGWMGRKEKWQEVDIQTVRYQGKKENLEYDEFAKWRAWVDEKESNK